jgi:hypothetical protein
MAYFRWSPLQRDTDALEVGIGRMGNAMRNTQDHSDQRRWVQSCITTVSFPTTLEGVRDWVGSGRTDLDVLLQERSGLEWTAPRWMTTGDILFFYHAVSATTRIRRLLKQAQSLSNRALLELLHHADQLAGQYAGTIFAYAEVAGPSEHLGPGDAHSHFKSTIFAPLKRIHVFEAPLRAEQFKQFVRINRQGTITLLGREEFSGLKHLLSQQNTLPPSLQTAEFGEEHFRTIDKNNWLTIACAPETRFIHEGQVRSFFLDFLLDELKDKGSALLKECQCFRQERATGYADYFVRIHNTWIPVEAKLSVLSERNIATQLRQYIHIGSMRPTIGPNRERTFSVADSPLCIVADHEGVYLTLDGSFVDGSPGSPTWRREQLDHATILGIREYVGALVS